MSGSEGYHLFTTIDPVGGLPRIGAIGHDRRPPGTYHTRTAGRLGAYAAVQIGLRGSGALWPDPAAPGRWLPIPPGHALLFVLGEDRIEYGLPPGATQAWEFVFANLEGAAARAMIHDIIASRGRIVPIPTMHAAVRDLLRLAHRDGPLALRLSGEAACRLAGQLVAGLIAPPAGDEHDLVTRCMALLDGDEGRAFAIAAIARRLGVSREHLTRVFTRCTGQPPARWLAGQRLARAEHLLGDPALPLAAVAQGAGFASAAAFARCFRSHHGLGPGAYRRQRPLRHNPPG